MQHAGSDPIVIACAADDNYAMPLAVTMRSILENLSPERSILLFILDGGIRASSKAKISRSLDAPNFQIKWVKPSEFSFETLPVSAIYPISIYYRLLLPQIIPTSIEKIIYLDTDLVVEHDLAQLWDLELGDHFLLAAQDNLRYISSVPHLDIQKFGISPDCKYFNSGVLVINLPKWRSEKVAERTIEFIQNYPEHIVFADQDALNMVLVGHWGELDPRWNYVYSDEVMQQTPYIFHFAMGKPWETNCTNPERGRFFRYVDMTAWRGWRNTIWQRALRKTKRLIYRQRVGY